MMNTKKVNNGIPIPQPILQMQVPNKDSQLRQSKVKDMSLRDKLLAHVKSNESLEIMQKPKTEQD